MSGYEKVSFLKFEAAGESWYVTDVDVIDNGSRVAHVRLACDLAFSGCVCIETGDWISECELLENEKSAIVEYLRANPLPGDGE